MLGLDAFVGDEGGALASVPGVKQLQERLGVIDGKLDKVLAGQKEAVALAEKQRTEAMEGQKRLERLVIDSAGGGAQALKAFADIRDCCARAIPRSTPFQPNNCRSWCSG